MACFQFVFVLFVFGFFIQVLTHVGFFSDECIRVVWRGWEVEGVGCSWRCGGVSGWWWGEMVAVAAAVAARPQIFLALHTGSELGFLAFHHAAKRKGWKWDWEGFWEGFQV